MRLLAIETSCDETSAAVIHDGAVLSNVVSSQVQLHAEYGGVVPELATREHLRNLPPVITAALKAGGIGPGDLEAVAGTQGPGLPNALMAGLKAAQGMAFALNIPFVGVHHHEAHLYSPWISGSMPVSTELAPPEGGGPSTPGSPPKAGFDAFQPNVSLIVSGGHTILVQVLRVPSGEGVSFPTPTPNPTPNPQGPRLGVRLRLGLGSRHGEGPDFLVLGSTLDDAAGECFDKTAKLIGLPYPGGPEMDRLASQGNPEAHAFPRPLLQDAGDDFSFAGLKTSVRYFLQKNPQVLQTEQSLRDLCASVQAAIVEVLVTKTIRAAKRLRVRCVTASGGVTCNSRLRRDLQAACDRSQLALRLAEPALCTDNAAMIGILGEQKLMRGLAATSLDGEARPTWSLNPA